MATKARHEGYLLIDHTDSPGAGPIPGGQKFEAATVTCSHCCRVVILNPNRVRARSYCAKCDHYICDDPICNAGCNPIAKQLDDAEAVIRNNLLLGS